MHKVHFKWPTCGQGIKEPERLRGEIGYKAVCLCFNSITGSDDGDGDDDDDGDR